MKKRKLPYLQRPLLERVRVNLVKARKLFELKEYSASTLRSFSAVEVFITGLIRTDLERKVGNPLAAQLPKRIRLEEKLTWCFESLYGFSVSQKYKTTFSRVKALARKRNEIAHEGSLASRKEAADGYATAKRVIKKLGARLKIDLHPLRETLTK